MAVRPSPDRSDLESKTREDLQTIAKVKGVDVSARASKASLIEAIMGDPAPLERRPGVGLARRALAPHRRDPDR